MLIPDHMRVAIQDKLRKATIVSEAGCWIWQKGKNNYGYGSVYLPGLGLAEKKTAGAHCVAYIVFKGPIPIGLGILHRCDDPACINPEHLYPGTKRDNSRDWLLRGDRSNNFQAKKTHCVHGHEYTEENTIYTKYGHRMCRSCNLEAVKSYQKRARGLKQVIRNILAASEN